MITLKEALTKSKEEIAALQDEIEQLAKESNLNAYVGFERSGEGIPLLIKDNIQVKEWSVTAASKILQGYKAPYDATVIGKLRAKGIAPMGRANMDEFAMGSTTESSFYGATKNPRDHERVPGGSSGGSAAAVAGGIAIAALGSDTGGSIRQPAAYCGCVGMKPTYGSVSRYGLGAYASSLDQIGPITQNVEDAAILFDMICGHDPKDSTSANIEHQSAQAALNNKQPLKIAIIPSHIEQASKDIQDAIALSIEKLKSAGHEIVEKELLDPGFDIAAYYVLATAEAATNLARYDGVRYGNRAECNNTEELFFNTRSEGFGDEVKRRIMLGNFVLSSGFYDAYYLKAQKVRQLIAKDYAKLFEEVDMILSPVAPSVAPKLGSSEDPIEMYKSDMYTLGVNLAGLPALSLPIMQNDQGLPVGLQFIAKAFDEARLFAISHELEQLVEYKN